mmetsp:Transcript_39769/g.106053  ORF Transcript_39769/g.106053 Transcript_39769/m.106053 type:complete len:232 (+) Transcript_39769:383-1078(+)
MNEEESESVVLSHVNYSWSGRCACQVPSTNVPWALHEGPRRVGGIRQNAALAADPDARGAAVATIAVLGRHIRATRLGVVAAQADVAIFAPATAPAVSHKPILGTVLLAEPRQLHRVVDVRVGLVAAVEDAAVVAEPAPRIDAHRDGADVGNGIRQGICVVEGQRLVACDAHLRVIVAHAVASARGPGHSASVGRQQDGTEASAEGVVERQLRRCALTTSSAAAMLWVRSA